MEDVKFSEFGRGRLSVGFQDEFGNIVTTFRNKNEINGAAMRAVNAAAVAMRKGGNQAELLNTAARSSLETLGESADISRFFDRLTTGDRDLVLLDSRFNDEPISDQPFRCPVAVFRGMQLEPCGVETVKKVNWGDVSVRKFAPDDIVWVLGFPCFKFVDRDAGIESATVRFVTVPVERESLSAERVANEPIGPQHFVLSRTIIELNGEGILDEAALKKYGRPYLFDENEIDKLGKAKIRAFNKAHAEHRPGPDLRARVLGKCGHESVNVLEVVSHFFEAVG
jgi:hypothetical protein